MEFEFYHLINSHTLNKFNDLGKKKKEFNLYAHLHYQPIEI